MSQSEQSPTNPSQTPDNKVVMPTDYYVGSRAKLSTYVQTIYPEYDWKKEEAKNAKHARHLFWFFATLLAVILGLAIFN